MAGNVERVVQIKKTIPNFDIKGLIDTTNRQVHRHRLEDNMKIQVEEI